MFAHYLVKRAEQRKIAAIKKEITGALKGAKEPSKKAPADKKAVKDDPKKKEQVKKPGSSNSDGLKSRLVNILRGHPGRGAAGACGGARLRDGSGGGKGLPACNV
jgi:hypothetical protein